MKLLNILIIFTFFGCNNSSPDVNDKTLKEETQPKQVLEVHTEKYSLPDSVIQKQQVFKKELKSGKVKFHVFSKNEEGTNQLIIKTGGFELINDSFIHTINGKVTNAEVADLNEDGYPEFYVFTSASNSKEFSEIIAYGSNRNKSATAIYVKPVEKNNPVLNDYKGSDELYIKDNKLIRALTNADPDKKISIFYKLTRGETSLILEIDKVRKGQ